MQRCYLMDRTPSAVEAVLLINQNQRLEGLTPDQAAGQFVANAVDRLTYYGIKTASDALTSTVDHLLHLGAIFDRQAAITYAEAVAAINALRPLTRLQAVAVFGAATVDRLDAQNVEALPIVENGRIIFSASVQTPCDERLQVRVRVDVATVEAVDQLDDLNWSDIFEKTAIYLAY